MSGQLFEHKNDLVNVAWVMQPLKADEAGLVKLPLHPGAFLSWHWRPEAIQEGNEYSAGEILQKH